MKIVIFLFFGMVVLSCSTSKNWQRVKFNYSVRGEIRLIKMNIPMSAKFTRITAGGEGEEHRYLYDDSSVIYITSMQGAATINEPLIVKNNATYNTKFSSDTATMEGIDDKGNYWKEIKNHEIFYGYSNVALGKKPLFDNALNSVQIK